MEQRVYFLVGDLLNCLGTGALAGYGVAAFIEPAWNDLLAMALGMLAGMAVAMVSGLIFTPLFGAMEVMLPGMLSGMLGGMLGSMVPSVAGSQGWCGEALIVIGMGQFRAWEMGLIGGAMALVFTYLLQAHYVGKVASHGGEVASDG